MRLIDADKLIEKLKSKLKSPTHRVWYEAINMVINLVNKQPTIQPQGIDKDRLIELLNTDMSGCDGDFAEEMAEIIIANMQQPQTGWIPCSERLPKDEANAFITDADGNVFMGWYDAQYDDRYGEWLVNECVVENIIAWKPIIIPQPYKESE